MHSQAQSHIQRRYTYRHSGTWTHRHANSPTNKRTNGWMNKRTNSNDGRMCTLRHARMHAQTQKTEQEQRQKERSLKIPGSHSCDRNPPTDVTDQQPFKTNPRDPTSLTQHSSSKPKKIQERPIGLFDRQVDSNHQKTQQHSLPKHHRPGARPTANAWNQT